MLDEIPNVWEMEMDPHKRARRMHKKMVISAKAARLEICRVKAAEQVLADEAERARLASLPCEPFGKSAAEIVQSIMNHRKVTQREVLSTARTYRVSHVRQEIAYWLRMKTHLSYPNIARFMGVKDHTSALYAVGKYAEKYNLEYPSEVGRPWEGAGRPPSQRVDGMPSRVVRAKREYRMKVK